MRTFRVGTLIIAALAFPAAALAKGPDWATISGPGISGSIRVDGDGEAGPGTPLGALVNYGGFPSQVFGHHPNDPTTRHRPAGNLGPRYHVVYSVPTPSGRRSLVADLYPYATPRPVTYMKPGQPFFQGMQTQGGWYVARPGLRRTLGQLGLPRLEPSDAHTWRWVGIAALAFGALAAVAAAVLLRRRPQSSPAPAS
jgi:hypothetical protein